jgi:nitroreductase
MEDIMKEVMKAIYNRRSTRSYKPEQIKRKKLAAVLDAGFGRRLREMRRK